MKRQKILTHEFVEYIPDELKDGTIYVSMPFATAAHKCCCGCGKEVITPLSPTDWKLIFDGQSISLEPSIGNWSFDCQSHYWIKCDRVRWAPRWTREEIRTGRSHDRLEKERCFDQTELPASNNADVSYETPEQENFTNSFWRKLKSWF